MNIIQKHSSNKYSYHKSYDYFSWKQSYICYPRGGKKDLHT